MTHTIHILARTYTVLSITGLQYKDILGKRLERSTSTKKPDMVPFIYSTSCGGRIGRKVMVHTSLGNT
jgi:hypothetical protein